MKPSKKIDNRLAARIAAHEAMMASHSKESKVQQRKESGGYTRPGSRKKN